MPTNEPPAPEQPVASVPTAPTPATSFPVAPTPIAQQALAALPDTAAPPVANWQPPGEVAAPPAEQYGQVFCRGCGTPVHPQATICVNCGVATGFGLPQSGTANPKSKTTAVVLAALFGLFGWIYTHQKDAWKFWLNLVLALVTLGIWALVAWVWAIIDMAVRPTEWYENFPNG